MEYPLAGVDLGNATANDALDQLRTKVMADPRNRPQYNISPEYAQNKNLAMGKAFGRNRIAQLRDTQLEQDAATMANAGRQYSSSSSGLLDMLSKVNKNKVGGMVQNAGIEAGLQNEGLNTLMGANVASAEEKDKAWNFNQNMPYQLQVEARRRQQQYDMQKSMGLMDIFGTLGASALLGPIGGAVGKSIFGE